MMATTAAALLDTLATRIEALDPEDKASSDDVYRCAIGTRMAMRGGRAVLLTALGANRINGGRTCSDWQTEITIDVFYQEGQNTMHKALVDAEQICGDLYSWMTADSDVLKVEPDLASPGSPSEGELVYSRTVLLTFRGTY